MTVVIVRGYAWIAERDGVAHATPVRGRSVRTLCGVTATDPRFAQPARVKCERCQEIADKT